MRNICRNFGFTVAFLISITDAHAQMLLNSNGGADIGSLGGVQGVTTGAISMIGNPAGLASATGIEIYFGGEIRQTNPDLKSASFAAALPSTSGTFGISMQYFGFELFNEQSIGAGYSRKLLEELSIGAQATWYQFSIPEYGRASFLTGELGILGAVSSTVSLGFSVHFPFGESLAENEDLPFELIIGISYQPTEALRIIADLSKQSGFAENFRFGLEYSLREDFAIRLGTATAPGVLSFGIAYRPKGSFQVSAGSSFHQDLGLSPLVGINYAK